MWYWGYYLGLTPKAEKSILRRGTLGHVGFQAAAEGKPHELAMREYAKENATEVEVDGEVFGVEADLEILTKTAGQLDRYFEFYDPWDKLENVEKRFEFRIKGIPFPIVGYWDGIVHEGPYSYVLERKLVTSFRTPEMLELDFQTPIYIAAARTLGHKVQGVIYDQVSTPPKDPKINQDGSVSRAAQGDWNNFKRFLLREGYDPADYQDMEEKLPFTKEFRREKIFRPEASIAAFMENLSDRAKDFAYKQKRIYMCDDRIRCAGCRFRDLCLEVVAGRDPAGMIEAAFKKKNQVQEVTEAGIDNE